MIYTLVGIPEPGKDGYEDFTKHVEELKKYANKELVDLLFVAITDICSNLDNNSAMTVDGLMGGWAYGHANAYS